MRPTTMAATLLAILSLASASVRAETPVFEISIKDHRFEPAVLEIPKGQKVKLVVKNQDATPEEFESYELNREKIIPGNSQGVVFIGPLEAGEYPFFGEFNQATAQGKVVAK
jgi:plastocyanin